MKYNGKNLRQVLVNSSPAVIDELMSSLDPTLKKDPAAISKCTLCAAVIRTSSFDNIIFDDVDFSDATIFRTNFTKCTFKNCVFLNTLFNMCYFIDVTFDGCLFIGETFFNNTDFISYKEINLVPGNEISNRIPSVCPSVGSFVGWKAVALANNIFNEHTGKNMRNCFVKLRIPAKAKRSSSSGRKCRCSEAKVLGFYDFDGNRLPDDLDARSMHDWTFKYVVGSTVKPDNGFEENRFIECAPGIHFFMNLQEAVNYLVI